MQSPAVFSPLSLVAVPDMPSATGESWEKYKKNFADEEEPEKKISPLSDELVGFRVASTKERSDSIQRYPGSQDVRRCSLRGGVEEARKADQRHANPSERKDRCQS